MIPQYACLVEAFLTAAKWYAVFHTTRGLCFGTMNDPMYVSASGNAYEETMLYLKRSVKEYDDVFSYYFTPEKPVAFTAGGYGHVHVFGIPEGEKPVREFSFASAPHETEILFTVDHRSGSGYQKCLQALTPGESVGLFKIKSHVTWPPGLAEESVMIAGGIGVTPFRSMLRDRKERNRTMQISLLHVARENYLFQDELRDLADSYEMLKREGAAERIRSAASDLPDAHFYIAGSPGFVAAASAVLKDAGIERIESDSFKGFTDPAPLLDISDF